MKKIISFLTISIILGFNAMAQNATDVIRLSQYYAGGTARSVGMSGSFGALGGDLSTLSFNPGGLGIYRSAEFTFTPALSFTKSDAFFDGVSYTEKNTRFKINNIGYVYTWQYNNDRGIQSLSFGVAYNRLSDFDMDAYVRTASAGSSMLDEFTYNANGGWKNTPIPSDDLYYGKYAFYEGLAWDTYALYMDNGYYYNDYYDANKGYVYGQEMRRKIRTRGGIGEYAISLAANLNHTLYFGATIGIHDVYYEESYYHEEFPGTKYLDYFNFSSDYTLNGWGLNFKAGLIYKPVQPVRIGLSIHTPTFYWVRPELLTGMETIFNESPPDNTKNEKNFFSETQSNLDRIKMYTPWRYNASIGFVIGQVCLLNVDAEFIDYTNAQMLPNSDYKNENDKISGNYDNTVNLKAGTEFRIGPMFLRGGVAYYGSPYEWDSFSDNGTISYSGGIGFRVNNFYLDAGYSYMKYPETAYNMYNIYDANKNELIGIDPQISGIANKVVVTLGFKF